MQGLQDLIDACNEPSALDVSCGSLIYVAFDEVIRESTGPVTRQFIFPRPCWVIGMFAGVIEGQADPLDQNPLTTRQTVDFAVTDEAQTHLVTSGTAAIAARNVNSCSLQGRGQRWFPMRKRIRAGDRWVITGSLTAANGVPTDPFQAYLNLRIQDEGR